MANPLQRLHDFGQSFWYDNIRRELLRNGELARMVREDGLRGVTSNPTIFSKALATGSDYDDSIRAHGGLEPADLFLELMIEDIQAACDVLRPVYEASDGADGFISIEVFPDLARNAQGTLAQARMLWERVARPNVMVKIPSTPECIPAIAAALEAGININITLMFGFKSYQDVAEAYISALEKRLAAGKPINHLASVASLFVSRVDTKVDKRLGAHRELQGKAGIANSRRMYQHFQKTFTGPRWEKLAAAGARPQRLLWASTSTKNPAYPDTLYADALVGPHTVDTMPDQTVAAYRDHGSPADRLSEAMANYRSEVQTVLDGLAQAGIDMEQVALELQNEGVDSFQASYDELIEGLLVKRARLSLRLEGPEKLLAEAAAELKNLEARQAVAAIWKPVTEAAKFFSADAAVQAKVANRLGWLRVADTMLQAAPEIMAFAAEVKKAGFTDALLLGMGGSSLAPDVFSKIFDAATGLNVHVLDTTDPDRIAHFEKRLQLEHTLFIVSSKSGGTLEPNCLFSYFWSKVPDGSHFVAITDAGTSLQKLAREHQFRRIFTNPGDIGGRYSALSYFGLAPAALQGVDIVRLLREAQAMAKACGADAAPAQNPGAILGAAIGAWARSGRDKLTFFPHPELQPFGAWVEQLLAESTGKQGRGIVPIDGETRGAAAVYGNDRVFVSLPLGGLPVAGSRLERGLAPLESSSPVVELGLADRYALGGQFFLWEFATALAGAVLAINPFDEPNVQESKDNTNRVLQHFIETGKLPEEAASAGAGGLQFYSPSGLDLGGWLGAIAPGDYVALMAYLNPTGEMADDLNQLRVLVRDRFGVATTLGFGPRFLHSTGQLHKGGANRGVFLQITATPAVDVPIPNQPYSFATLLAAQAVGDYQSLAQHQRRLLRVDLGRDVRAGLDQLTAALQSALAAKVKA